MNRISNRYNVSPDTIKRMVKDGLISSKWPLYEEVYNMFLQKKDVFKTKEQVYNYISEVKNIPTRTVRHMIEAVDKI